MSRTLRGALAAIGVLALFVAVSAGAGTQSAAAISFGNKCSGHVHFRGERRETLTLVHESKWATDTWLARPPQEIRDGSSGEWATEGGTFRGCHNDVKYHVTCPRGCRGGIPFLAKADFSETFHWDPTASPQYDCRISDDIDRGTDCDVAHSIVADHDFAAQVAVFWNVRQKSY